MTFNYGKRTIHVKANSEILHTSCNSILISRHQLANISTTEELFTVCTTTVPKENSESMSPEAKGLMKEYQDVFSTSLPNKLPPKRAIDHTIDLVPGSESTSWPIYRLSYLEMNELKRQLSELMEKGFIHPSVSPLVLLFSLFTKRMEL